MYLAYASGGPLVYLAGDPGVTVLHERRPWLAAEPTPYRIPDWTVLPG
jgi:hypothetical protein